MRNLPGHMLYIPVIPFASAHLTLQMQFVFCLGALAHCLFTLYLLLQHVLTSPFPPPLCVFSQPFKVSELPDNAMTLLLLSGVA